VSRHDQMNSTRRNAPSLPDRWAYHICLRMLANGRPSALQPRTLSDHSARTVTPMPAPINTATSLLNTSSAGAPNGLPSAPSSSLQRLPPTRQSSAAEGSTRSPG
jgi:hypothetical protein